MELTLIDAIPETLSEMLLPNDPAQAREMAAFHLNALLRCIIQSHTEEPVVGEVADYLARIEALIAG